GPTSWTIDPSQGRCQLEKESASPMHDIQLSPPQNFQTTRSLARFCLTSKTFRKSRACKSKTFTPFAFTSTPKHTHTHTQFPEHSKCLQLLSTCLAPTQPQRGAETPEPTCTRRASFPIPPNLKHTHNSLPTNHVLRTAK